MNSIFASCRHCDGHGSHDVWGLSAAEPVRSFTCAYCHGTGLVARPSRPLATVHDLVAARANAARRAVVTEGPRCTVFAGGKRGAS